MAKLTKWTLAITLGLIAAGCAPQLDDDDDDNTPYALESGSYVETAFNVVSDGCNAGFEASVDPIDIEVTETTVTIEGTTEMERSGNNLTALIVEDEDLRPELDCVLHYELTITGAVVADNAFDVAATYDIDATAGADCESIVEATLPCESSLTASYALVTN